MVEVGCPSKVQANYGCHLCLLQGSGGPGFSSTRGITIFSAMSVSSENVGYTMKSMNPAEAEQGIITCAFQLTWCRMETGTGSRSFSRKFGERKVLHTDLGLGYQRAVAITQRREGQAELRLSIALTKTDKERGDILKGIPHSPENSFGKVIWFQHSPPQTCCHVQIIPYENHSSVLGQTLKT